MNVDRLDEPLSEQDKHVAWIEHNKKVEGTPLYTKPQQKQEQGEPVCDKDPRGCWSIRCQLGKKCKNTPQTKEWVGLTTAQLNSISDRMRTWNSFQITDVYFAIEAKLRELNGYE